MMNNETAAKTCSFSRFYYRSDIFVDHAPELGNALFQKRLFEGGACSIFLPGKDAWHPFQFAPHFFRW